MILADVILGDGEGRVSEREVYRAAKALIAEYGAYACAYASREANEHLVDGDMTGHDLWTRLLFAAGEMLATQRPDGVAVH